MAAATAAPSAAAQEAPELRLEPDAFEARSVDGVVVGSALIDVPGRGEGVFVELAEAVHGERSLRM